MSLRRTDTTVFDGPRLPIHDVRQIGATLHGAAQSTLATAARVAAVKAYYAHNGIDALQIWREYEGRQWSTKQDFTRHTDRLLEQALTLASRQCPYYRAQGCRPSLDSFPPLEKREILDNMDALIAPEHMDKRCYVSSTSGTSGRVLDVWVDHEERKHRLASSWRGSGFPALPGGPPFEPWSATAMLWGNTALGNGALRGLKSKAANSLFSRIVWNCFGLDREQAREIHAGMLRQEPRRIIGYVSALVSMARYCQEMGLEPVNCEKVVPTAEQLDESSAGHISACFMGPMRQRYGCREAGDIAAQCEYGTWHLFSDFVYLEVQLPNGCIAKEGRGNLLITKLHNRVMPLIRYNIEDEVTLGGPPCPCGRALPVMRELQGRRIDQLLTAEGGRVSGLAVARTLRGVPHYEFQAVQEQAGECTLLLVPQPAFRSEHAELICQAWPEHVGAGIRCRLELVESIPGGPGGKRRQVLSLIELHEQRQPGASLVS